MTPTAATERLEVVPQSVICGFEWAIGSRDLWEVERRLNLVEPEFRGYAYEGATMAFVIRDALRGNRTRELMLGPGQPHLFLNYIGVGFALARLPRRLWQKVLPDLTGSPYHPMISWLAIDGYGFDRAYFRTDRWVTDQRIPAAYPWEGSPDYFLRAVDQGIGRALWFIHGGQVEGVATAARRFATHRQADLWSGVGLAATFAGGYEPDALAALRRAAGEHRDQLGLGAVLAVRARDYSGFVPAHTEAATAALTGLTVGEAVDLADRCEVTENPAHPVPAYELWRQRIAAGVPDSRSAEPGAAEPGAAVERGHTTGP